MAKKPKYSRVVLKLSGELLSGDEGCGADPAAISAMIDEILPVKQAGVQLALVVGGGNFVRARDLLEEKTIRRVTADYMGMLGTVMNAIAMRDSLLSRNVAAEVMSAIPMPTICEGFSNRRADELLRAGQIVIFAGGTGSPFFTTDTCAALRACEIDAQLLIKATKVEGVYDSDPMINPNAAKYDRLTYQKVLTDQLAVMDLTAVSLCAESGTPIIVCQLFAPGNLLRAVRGEKVGTLVTA